jgi:hypothetical protein
LMCVLVLTLGYKVMSWVLFSAGIGCVMTSMVFAALEIYKGTRALDDELSEHMAKFSTWTGHE